MSTIALSGRHLSLKFADRAVLDDINIDIHCGQVTALLGPNGAGKSTLLKLLSGEIPSDNDIRYFGLPKQQWPLAKLAKHLGMLPQHSTLSFPFLAHEVVELGAIPLDEPSKVVASLAKEKMEMTDVLHLAKRPYPSLSGGEKQRLHLARVLVQLAYSGEQTILMLDEPTSALDLAHQQNTLRIARELARNTNAAVVVVLHDLNLAAQFADRMVVLHNGKIVCDDRPENALSAQLLKQVYHYDAIISRHPTLGFPYIHPAA
ncbi:heme ABC transporter ATP-binding protein [Vibrio sinaloensis]|uniref:heme ABC transporter ATP-binding protein n=1 Tax=Photobacterium sp. (strain ATCC 43367) TaxID=379097 RepID=UPI002069744B|nr:heme ABC transporter ATP-binding protein [Vibrio sinaloensis]UPQ90177.1 heme ABC transporter ATP-binding protein [Vibrio sinaloensis]